MHAFLNILKKYKHKQLEKCVVTTLRLMKQGTLKQSVFRK